MRISKYQPWTDYLQNHPDMFCRMSFSDIERLIGDNLPDTCKAYATVFWNNSNGHYAKHWLKAGRIVVEYSISQNYAIFKKDPVAILTGIYTGDNERNWIFYTLSTHIFGRKINEALAQFELLPITIYCENDPDWNEYQEMKELSEIDAEE